MLLAIRRDARFSRVQVVKKLKQGAANALHTAGGGASKAAAAPAKDTDPPDMYQKKTGWWDILTKTNMPLADTDR